MTDPSITPGAWRAHKPVIYMCEPAGRPLYFVLARSLPDAAADAGLITGPGTRTWEAFYAWDYLTLPVTADRVPQPHHGIRLADGTCLFHVAGGPREFRVLAADPAAAAELARGILGTEPGAFTLASQGNAPLHLADIAAHIAARSAAVPAGSAA